MKNDIILCLMALFCLTACEDNNERVFKQHLYKHLTDAKAFMETAVEARMKEIIVKEARQYCLPPLTRVMLYIGT